MALSNQNSEGISISIYKSAWVALTLSLQQNFSGPGILEFQPPKSGAVLELNHMVVPSFLGCIRWWALLIPQTWALYWGICQVIVGYLPLSLDLSEKVNEKPLLCRVLPSSECPVVPAVCLRASLWTWALGRGWFGWRPLQPCLVTLTKQCSAAHPGWDVAEQGHLAWVSPAVDNTPVLAHSGPQQHAQNSRTVSGCTFVFISWDSKSLGSPRTPVE